jgi:pimeloyl-ACP methyl ester carboxylesterase
MAPSRIVFLGGNGHCAERLAAARKALAVAGVELWEARYPGFEGRARAADLERFLGAVAHELAAGGRAGLVYATGIGGLIALCLRARDGRPDVPLLLQAPVLWGLERRLLPRIMRLPWARAAARRVFAWSPFQRRFLRRHFVKTPLADVQAAFFDGYARCGAFPDLFAWFTPARLRRLERDLAAQPAVLRDVTVWWGGRDRVVTPRELRWTEQALGTTWPLRVFPDWGHYPMIDEPEAWAGALAGVVKGIESASSGTGR